jgi:cell division transport system permease protein
MPLYLRKAFEDIAANRFLNAVSMITIALAVLIVSAFALFFINATNLLDAWRQGVRLMVYLEGDLSEARRLGIKYQLQQMPEVGEARFVGRDEALERLHRQMGPQASLLNGIEENPLPDAFQVELKPETLEPSQVELLAKRIADLQGVEEVSYGQQWLSRFGGLLKLFRLAGYSLGALFFMAAVFFVANTIRLVLYSRQEEVSIMRLVGASERFIRTPFYIEALIQGAVGGLLGLAALYGLYLASLANVTASLGGIGFSFHFLPWHNGAMAVAAGMIVGWLGCFVSLKQFLTAA